MRLEESDMHLDQEGTWLEGDPTYLGITDAARIGLD